MRGKRFPIEREIDFGSNSETGVAIQKLLPISYPPNDKKGVF